MKDSRHTHDGSRGPEQSAAATDEALNASYRLAAQLWMPWIRPFFGTASPFIPPEQYVRACGDIATAWMSMAHACTTGLCRSNPPPTTPGLPNFIEWQGDQQSPPPYAFEGVDIWAFPTVGDHSRLTDVVDKFLNAPLVGTNIEYRPWRSAGLGIVYIAALWYERMRTIPWSNRGFTSQHELVFMIPVNRYDSGRWTGWALFTPYVFVDNPWSIVAGNTVIGYPKARADFSIDGSASDPYPIAVDALAFRQFDPNRPATIEPLIKIRNLLDPPPTVGDVFWPLGPFEALFGEKGNCPLEEETYRAVLATLSPTIIPGLGYDIVQLKQIRDAVNPELATCQGVYEYDVELERWVDGGILQPAEVTINATATWPIASALGLSDVFTCLHPFWHRVDYKVGKGRLQP